MKARFDSGPLAHTTIDVDELADQVTMPVGSGLVRYRLVRIDEGVGVYLLA